MGDQRARVRTEDASGAGTNREERFALVRTETVYLSVSSQAVSRSESIKTNTWFL